MTKEEMINFIKENPNIKITHPLFNYDEYIFQENGKIYDENNYIFEDWNSDISNGLRIRTDEEWNRDWQVKQDNQTCKLLSMTTSGKSYLYNNLCRSCQRFRACCYL